ncbi:STAS/SEC14 domain-containing protein [Shewanella sp. JM162201]|uniref:STAS/SEC14 domain-containing protein n=1 Tax=Shewanella jiangmenensis TaxID=2837387 RepID=A0ABS5V7G6_9GAMM|nr:STAS/SEC14 domain-containing protein [Shewanella jiangmenensis]MBT1445606.1 STAS/SEC14 domain-containing protein [Shewanella jiangmenensis]
MISVQTGFEHDTLAVKASGLIVPEDFSDVLLPELELRLKDHASVRLWYEIDPECRGMRLSALWQDFLIGLFHLSDFQRVAIITDKSHFSRIGDFIALLMPCPVRVFSSKDDANARAWLSDGR